MKTCGVSHGFAWLAQSTAPRVKVIYNVRNPLDIALSDMKYAQGHLSQELAHCEAGAGGAECRNAHLKAGTGLHVDIERTIQLVKWASQEEEGHTPRDRRWRQPWLRCEWEGRRCPSHSIKHPKLAPSGACQVG